MNTLVNNCGNRLQQCLMRSGSRYKTSFTSCALVSNSNSNSYINSNSNSNVNSNRCYSTSQIFHHSSLEEIKRGRIENPFDTNPLAKHNNQRASIPLIEHYTSRWPEPDVKITESNAEALTLPKRTVPDEALRFELKATYDHGSSILHPHMDFNPADFKVKLYVLVKDLGLTPQEKDVFVEMVGKR